VIILTLEVVILLFSEVLVSGVCACAVLLLLYSFYNPVGVVIFSSIVCGHVVFLVVVH